MNISSYCCPNPCIKFFSVVRQMIHTLVLPDLLLFLAVTYFVG